MMGGAWLPDDMHKKVALEAIVGATQLDGIVVIDINGRLATHDVHMIGVNPKWTRNLRVWGQVKVITVGKDSKTSDKGATMIFVVYGEHESVSVRMWDP
jgi:hypothetical protein